MSKYTQTQEFSLEGRFIGFAAEEGYKLKLIRVATSTGEYRIKMPKELRSFLYRTLTPGEWVQVQGYQKLEPEQGKVKLKAVQITPTAACQHSLSEAVPMSLPPSMTIVPSEATSEPVSEIAAAATSQTRSARTKSKPQQDCILVCQKSDCCKRGGHAVTQALQSALTARGLADQVTIRGTGCMKQCKAGPNVVMPDRSRYTRIRPEEIPALIARHFPDTSAELAS